MAGGRADEQAAQIEPQYCGWTAILKVKFHVILKIEQLALLWYFISSQTVRCL